MSGQRNVRSSFTVVANSLLAEAGEKQLICYDGD
jgi:hypothetical protein